MQQHVDGHGDDTRPCQRLAARDPASRGHVVKQACQPESSVHCSTYHLRMGSGLSPERPAAPYLGLPGIGLALTGLAGTAGVIHVVAALEHVGASLSLGVFFALVGAGQLLAAWRIHRDPHNQRLLEVVALGSITVALLWLVSRTTGLPFGPDAGTASSIGAADTIATLHELAFAAIVVAMRGQPQRDRSRLAWLSTPVGVRLIFAFLSMTLLVAAMGGHEH